MFGRIVGLIVSLSLCSTAILADDNPSREFPAHNCKYTLPDKDWTWLPLAAPNMVLLADNGKGLRVTLATAPAGRERINEASAKAFESTYYENPAIKKRGGRLTTFQNAPTYQTEGDLGNKTFATRYFIADGTGYILTVIGGEVPVEIDPQFDSIMNGFSFLSPPVIPAGDVPKEMNISQLMGKVAATCFMLALFFYVVRKIAGTKAKPKKARRVHDDEDGEE